jgi:hypothetical protein
MKTHNHELPRKLTSEELDIVAGGQVFFVDNSALIAAEKAGLIRPATEQELAMAEKQVITVGMEFPITGL